MTGWNNGPIKYDRNYAGCLSYVIMAAALAIIVAGTWLTSEGVIW